MPISLKSLNKPVRFNYPDEDGEEWVELRLVSGEKMDEIRKNIGIKVKSKIVANTITKKMEAMPDIDIPDNKISEFNDLCLDYQMPAWNIAEPDGSEIPCTLENKKLLMGGEPVFAAWVNAKLKTLQGKIDEIEGDELKN